METWTIEPGRTRDYLRWLPSRWVGLAWNAQCLFSIMVLSYCQRSSCFPIIIAFNDCAYLTRLTQVFFVDSSNNRYFIVFLFAFSLLKNNLRRNSNTLRKQCHVKRFFLMIVRLANSSAVLWFRVRRQVVVYLLVYVHRCILIDEFIRKQLLLAFMSTRNPRLSLHFGRWCEVCDRFLKQNLIGKTKLGCKGHSWFLTPWSEIVSISVSGRDRADDLLRSIVDVGLYFDVAIEISVFGLYPVLFEFSVVFNVSLNEVFKPLWV
jgi:hypothetical protein